jgi:predicted acyltransferase
MSVSDCRTVDPQAAKAPSTVPTKRLWSVDAFRGLVMAGLIVSWPLVPAVSTLPPSRTRTLVLRQLTHAPWHGFTRADFTFAGFVMLLGLGIVLSFSRRLERGVPRTVLYRRLLRRTCLLLVLGILFNGGFSQPWPEIRLVGVLQRLGICFLIGGILYLHAGKTMRVGILASILLGYWALMALVPVPGYGSGNLTFDGNLAAYVDGLMLPGRKLYGSWDPEGLLTTIPAIASCLIGMMWGELLLNDRITPAGKALRLLIGGYAAFHVGLLWDLAFPVIKSLWTSSYVMLAAGVASILLGICVLLADVWGFRRILFPFVVVGRNLLVAYSIMVLVPLEIFSQRLVGGSIASLLGDAAPFAAAFCDILIVWFFLYWMYRNRLFVRI